MNELKTQIYEQLDKLDDFLVAKNSSERMAYGLIGGVLIAAIIYFALFDLSTGFRTEGEGVFNEIYGKLTQEEDYIESMDNGGFLRLEQQIRDIKTGIEQSKETRAQLEELTNEIYTHSKDWFLTFDEASDRARKIGLIVNGTDIEMSQEAGLGGMKYTSFILFGYGKFQEILRYIDWLEAYGKFISIDSIVLESKDRRLNFIISIRNFRGGI